MKKISLTFEQRYAIAEWLRNNEERIKTDRPLLKELAEQASKALNLTCTANQVTEIAMVARVTWEPRIFQRRGAVLQGGRLTAVEEAVARLEKDYLKDGNSVQKMQAELAQLRSLVVHLYKTLGEKPPHGLHLAVPDHIAIAATNGA